MSEGSGSVGFDGLLRQGGDPRARAASVSVDLSTCVCRYGPPAAAVEAFAALGPEQLREHPYRAAAALTAAYAEYLDVEPGRLVVGRGASEFIWRLARSPLADRVAVPLPAYTEYVLAFPGANRGGPGAARSGVHHGLAEIDALLGEGRVVLISNPHNPSGRALPADELAAVAQANSAGLLVVDESYVEFVAEPERFTLVGRAGANVVVLRSPSKFFGLAGCRVAVALAGARRWRELLAPVGSWPVSQIEVAPVVGALAARAWQRETRAALQADAAWLDGRLASIGTVVEGSVAHFRLVPADDAATCAAALARAGVGVRVLDASHGLGGPHLRIAACRLDERDLVASALTATRASRGR